MNDKCYRCGKWYGTTLDEVITTTGRQTLCRACTKIALDRDEVFLVNDALADWSDESQATYESVIRRLNRFPAWVALAFGFAVLEHFGLKEYTHLAALMETIDARSEVH